MKKYHDFYGCQAIIKPSEDGTVRLTIRDYRNRPIHAKSYKTERGARIAMGKMSDGWKECSA